VTFEILIGVAAFVAGAIASIAGFGIGSILTPLLSLKAGTRLAFAAISIPHRPQPSRASGLLRKGLSQ
jgi:uncharacterized membrane protein YfcA